MMYIGFSSNRKNIFSKLIRLFTKSKWSHCFIVHSKIGHEDMLIIESSLHGGVKFNLLSKYWDNPKFDCELVPVSSYPIDSLLPFIGDSYGVLQILTNGISRILGLKQNFYTKDTVCSELVWLWMKDSGYKVEHLDQNKVSPQDLHEVLRGSNENN